MHMSDALISPIVGGTMMATSGGVLSYSIKRLKIDIFEKKLPLMGIMGAFMFAAQMINFSIPGTGSSGHIGGGLLLAIILGPQAGFLTMSCVLFIQSLFFADGGLLALGCNLMNMGFFAAYIAYPFIYKKIIRKNMNKKTIMVGTIIGAIIGLQLGSLSVVLETIFSGKTEFSFVTFLLFMQPIHLAIGLIEGIITGIVINYVFNQSPYMLYDETIINDKDKNRIKVLSNKKVLLTFMIATFIIGGFISLYASSLPDGLEWAIEKTVNTAKIESHSLINHWFEKLQSNLAIMPEYSFKNEESNNEMATSLSGIVGSIITLSIAIFVGIIIKKVKKRVNYNE